MAVDEAANVKMHKNVKAQVLTLFIYVSSGDKYRCDLFVSALAFDSSQSLTNMDSRFVLVENSRG